MKGVPQNPEPEIGACYRAVNAAIKAAQQCRTIEEVIDLLGEPDYCDRGGDTLTPTQVFEALGSVLRFGDEDVDVVLIYLDPYRPRFRYKFGFLAGTLNWTMRETVAA
jgi:hypothetical protein